MTPSVKKATEKHLIPRYVEENSFILSNLLAWFTAIANPISLRAENLKYEVLSISYCAFPKRKKS